MVVIKITAELLIKLIFSVRLPTFIRNLNLRRQIYFRIDNHFYPFSPFTISGLYNETGILRERNSFHQKMPCAIRLQYIELHICRQQSQLCIFCLFSPEVFYSPRNSLSAFHIIIELFKLSGSDSTDIETSPSLCQQQKIQTTVRSPVYLPEIKARIFDIPFQIGIQQQFRNNIVLQGIAQHGSIVRHRQRKTPLPQRITA